MPIEVGQIINGKVTGIAKFGAFVELPDGVTGLVHISEVADSYVKDVNDYLKIDDMVKVKVIGVSDDGKVSLSIRKTKEEKPNDNRGRQQRQQDSLSFEDKIAKFMKESEERLLDIKRNNDAKRKSGGYKKRAYY